jgi:hypothetical protein
LLGASNESNLFADPKPTWVVRFDSTAALLVKDRDLLGMTDATTANLLAYTAILAWPIVALILFHKRPLAEAIAWTFLGALLFLPSRAEIKIPLVPAIDKDSIASASSLLGCVLFAPRVKRWSAIAGLAALLASIYVVSPVLTSLLNNDPVVAGSRVIAGVDYYDGVSALLSQTIHFLPFFVGLIFLRKSEDVETILRTLVLGGLVYSVPMLFEIRMSPQLSAWIYGYFPSSFPVEMRYGGFRPVVFMINGLTAAFFLSTAVIASVSLWRTKTSVLRLPPAGVSAYLGIVLVFCKSAGALVYAVFAGLAVRWLSVKVQVRAAVILATLAISYPVLRVVDLVPAQRLLELATTFSEERAQSLGVRFDQEEQLLARAYDRFWFGWGRYGRNRVYDDSGKDVSITDGQWILTLGQFGMVGFIAQFGLLTIPVFFAARNLRFVSSTREQSRLAALSLIVALVAIEQLPNASISPWTWLLAGLLYGRARAIRLESLRSKGTRPSAPHGLSVQRPVSS